MSTWDARIYLAGKLRADGEGYEPARVAREWKTYATLWDAHDAARAVSHENAGIATFAGNASPYQSGSLFCMCSTCDELRKNRRNAL